MDEINLNVGKDGSTIDGSNVTVGNVTLSKPVRRSRAGQNDIQKRLAEIEQQFNEARKDLDNFTLRMVDVERLLGGQWGMPGMVAKVEQIASVITSIQDDLREMREDIKSSKSADLWLSKLYMAVATALFVTSIYLFVTR